MKKNTYLILIVIMSVFISMNLSKNCFAAVKVAETPGYAAVSGNYIYYENNGVLYKYNRTSKKRTTIGKGGFDDVSVKDGYIYYVKADNYIDADSYTYFEVHRMKNNGKNEKMLAYGRSPLIIGNWIYYIETELVDSQEGPWTKDTGYISKMKLNGSSKKRVKYIGRMEKLYKYGNKVLYSTERFSTGLFESTNGKTYSLTNKTNRPISCYRELYDSQGTKSPVSYKIRNGYYLYYVKRIGWSNSSVTVNNIYRMSANKKNEKMIYDSNGNNIYRIYLLPDNIIAQMYSTTGYNRAYKTVILKLNGKVEAELYD